MPPGFVRTLGEAVLYEYAKLIARSARKPEFAFVTDRFKALRDGVITMSGTMHEWQKEQELPRACAYCGATGNLQADHMVPRSRGGADKADNMVLACRSCNASRGDSGIYEWIYRTGATENLSRLVEGKYLKALYDLHQARDTLGVSKDSLGERCPGCRNRRLCKERGIEGKLSVWCLESVF